MHGLKSGKMLKEFVGHTSYVNDAIYSPDGSQIISAASDSTVRVWDAKSCEELRAFKYAVKIASRTFKPSVVREQRRHVEGLELRFPLHDTFKATIRGHRQWLPVHTLGLVSLRALQHRLQHASASWHKTLSETMSGQLYALLS